MQADETSEKGEEELVDLELDMPPYDMRSFVVWATAGMAQGTGVRRRRGR